MMNLFLASFDVKEKLISADIVNNNMMIIVKINTSDVSLSRTE